MLQMNKQKTIWWYKSNTKEIQSRVTNQIKKKTISWYKSNKKQSHGTNQINKKQSHGTNQIKNKRISW